MKVAVFGLGYVGVVTAACLAADGHDVLGIDPNATKVDCVNRGLSPIVEADVPELVAAARRSGRLAAVRELVGTDRAADVSLVCVGTPSAPNGSLDLRFVRNVCEQIGATLCRGSGYHVVVVRSTLLPGTMRDVVIPLLEAASGLTAGRDFGVCINPEFLREGSAVRDYRRPPKTVIGEIDARSGDVVAALVGDTGAPLTRTDLATAEMVKYVDNVWHAAKVAFANEIGVLCKGLSVDSHRVMEIFCTDTQLNLSAAYLTPGFAFGGSCLPKDVRAVSYKAKALDLELPLINSLLPSNQAHIERALRTITSFGLRRIGVLGFAFKAGTDDLRESPIVLLIEHLLGKGYELVLYDENVNAGALTGANRDFIFNLVPHLSRLMVRDPQEVVDRSELVVVGNRGPGFAALLRDRPPSTVVVDLVRVLEGTGAGGRYEGICW